jgi:RNA-directed DNA polymerase
MGDRWSWVEPLVWTERMLEALEYGIKGGKWYSLMDKLYPVDVLRAAYAKVAANRGAAGVDHVTITIFALKLDENLKRLSDDLRSGTYRPQSIRRHYIPKPGGTELRPLGIPTVRDRVVQTALRMVLEPIYERDFAEHSYGFRPGRGCQDALRRVDHLLRDGYTHVVDVDLKSYFDTIPKDRLLTQLEERVTDGRILALVELFLAQPVLEEAREWTPSAGTPQGAVISPLLSNIYLDPLDHLMAAGGYEMVRYADDVVVLCRSPEDAATALAQIQQWTATAGLTLHPVKTRLVDALVEDVEFLGYRFQRVRRRWPRAKSLKKFKDMIRVKTRRTNGRSLPAIIADLNPRLRGWFEYYKHCYRTTFSSLDGWIRRRLRSLLRKRQKRQGISRGADHQRWPNAFFSELGLFNLQAAHARALQSSRR